MFKKITIFIVVLFMIGLIHRQCFSNHEVTVNNPDKNILCDFEDAKIWSTSPERGFSLKTTEDHATQGKHSLKVRFPKDDLPSINTKKIKIAWKDNDSISLDIFNLQDQIIAFCIRLDDSSKKRMNISYKLKSGLNTIKLSRAEISSKINASDIFFMVLYLDNPEEKYELYFDNMRLEHTAGPPQTEKAKFEDMESGLSVYKSDPLMGFNRTGIWETSSEQGFTMNLSKEHVTEGDYSLEVLFPHDEYPGISTKKLPVGWGNYDFLTMDVFNPQDIALDFTIRLDDAAGKRINIPWKLPYGMNHVKIPWSSIASGISASDISFMVLFLDRPMKPCRLFFDNMALVRSGISEVNKSLASLNAQLPSMKQLLGYGQMTAVLSRLKTSETGIPLISSGIPFAPGVLKSKKYLTVYNANGIEIPSAKKVLATWPKDGSIRSILVQFRYPAGDNKSIIIKWNTQGTAREPETVTPDWDYPEGIILLPKNWLCYSRVIGEQIPFGESRFIEYDNNIAEYFPVVSKIPWTGDLREDGYYSSPHAYYQLYVRTGELPYFLAARKELIHYRETQLILDGNERGRAKDYKEPRYIYVQALADDYLLTGDPRSLLIAGYMAEHLRKNYSPDNAFYPKSSSRFWTERRQAFPLLGLVTYYGISQDKEYLRVADSFIKNLRKTQLEWPHRGGFIHNLFSHDPGEGARPDEYGGSPFMTGLLLEGIVEYHRITGSETAKDSILSALDWLINEALVSGGDSFRYLTCDNYPKDSEGTPDLNMLIVHAFGYGYRLSGYKNEKYLNTGLKIFEKGIESAYLKNRKHFNQNYRSSGHFLAYISEEQD